MAVDDNEQSAWASPETTGWLEFDLPKPVTVASLRMTAAYHKIGNFALEYKDGDAWKPILTGEKVGPHQYAVIKEFAPVTAQIFRLSVLESDDPVRIRMLSSSRRCDTPCNYDEVITPNSLAGSCRCRSLPERRQYRKG